MWESVCDVKRESAQLIPSSRFRVSSWRFAHFPSALVLWRFGFQVGRTGSEFRVPGFEFRGVLPGWPLPRISAYVPLGARFRWLDLTQHRKGILWGRRLGVLCVFAWNRFGRSRRPGGTIVTTSGGFGQHALETRNPKLETVGALRLPRLRSRQSDKLSERTGPPRWTNTWRGNQNRRHDPPSAHSRDWDPGASSGCLRCSSSRF